MTIDEVKLIQLPKIIDERGNLTFIEARDHIPFEIKRVDIIYDVAKVDLRDSRTYEGIDEIIISLSGCFDVLVDDGAKKKTFILNSSNNALYVPYGILRSLYNFSTNSICLVLVSNVNKKTQI